MPSFAQHVRINHRRFEALVAEQLLHRPDVRAVADEVRGKGVAQGMGCDIVQANFLGVLSRPRRKSYRGVKL